MKAIEQAGVLRSENSGSEQFRPGWERKIVHTSQLMTVVIDISNGPWAVPDAFHSHPHEQICYVAEGELLFLAEGQEPEHLTKGDLFAVPSGVPHSIQLLSQRARLIDSFTPIREDFLLRD